MKRFWKAADWTATDEGWTVRLDGRPVRTPARTLLAVPSEPLAEAIAGEWSSAPETVDPRAMPLTGLANAAVDRIAPDPDRFAGSLACYAASDLLAYRAENPRALVEWQARHWDPLLAWARRFYDIDVLVTAGVQPIDQPPATIERLSHAVLALDRFRLAGLSPMVTIGGSLIAALAVAEEAVAPEEAWAAVSADERWQLDRWGRDPEAEQALDGRRRDFIAGARFLELLR